MPLYLGLGALSGVVAWAYTQTSEILKTQFDKLEGQSWVFYKPVMGGILCGVIGLKYPEILFFGYETLNNILQNETIPTALLVQLLGLKIFSTAFCQASGL